VSALTRRSLTGALFAFRHAQARRKFGGTPGGLRNILVYAEASGHNDSHITV